MMPNVGGLPRLAERAVAALEHIARSLELIETTLTDRSGEISEGVRRLADAEDNYCGAPLPGWRPPTYCVHAKGHDGPHGVPSP